MEKPNPYFEALPKINAIINRNRRVNLLDGEFSIYKDLEQLNEQNNQQQRLPTPGVPISKEIVLSNKQTSQTNPITGLTETQTALLSPEDQIIQQRLNKNKPITLVG